MKKIDSSNYDEKYYFEYCGGYKEFKKSFGKEFDRRNNRLIKEIPYLKNKKVLDVGCGRGELVFWVANEASRVWGTDYSPSAIKIANIARKHYSKKIISRVKFEKMDATNLKFPDKSFDLVIYTDVHEHLYRRDAEKAFSELVRVLKDNGKIFFHTEPNKLFYDFAWKFWCYPVSTLLIYINKLITNNKYINIPKPSKVRNEIARKLHINEADYFYLKSMFNKFKVTGNIKTTNIVWIKPIMSWKDIIYNLLVYLDPLSRIFPFNILFGQDFLAVLIKK